MSSLKEELLFRHSLGAGFQYPAPPGTEADRTSLSPESKDTGSGGSPSHGEALSDSCSEKKRARKQKPRRVVQWPEGSPDERYARARHSSEFSHGQPMQQEPEDLTVKPRLEALRELQEYRRRQGSEYSFSNYRRESLEKAEKEAEYFKAERGAEYFKKRGSGSEGSSHSPQSTQRADEDEEDDRGVSPPLSHPPLYNPLFSGPAAIQLGLAAGALPLRFNGESEADRLGGGLVAKTEISQQ